MADNSDVADAVASLLAQPTRMRTDAGEAEMPNVADAVKAAEFVIKTRAQSGGRSPFGCLHRAQVSLPDASGSQHE
jgi:hypothetical protein